MGFSIFWAKLTNVNQTIDWMQQDPYSFTMPSDPSPTRLALLDAAEQLFSQRAYAEIGIREIAQQAGVNIAAIKYHFGSKHDLYLATVQRAMSSHGGEVFSQILANTPRDRGEAALQLAQFIRYFFTRMHETASLDTCGSLMIREALQPSEAIDAVVEDYLKPSHDLLNRILAVLNPQADAEQRSHDVELLLGQLLHYRIFRPFIERLDHADFTSQRFIEDVITWTIQFTLRGLGCEVELITQTLQKALKQPHSLTEGSHNEI